MEAVIDKDRASALLASRLGVDLFIISTDADRVYVNYKKPDQRPLDRVTAGGDGAATTTTGQFPPGNMGPKIESALRFLRDGGREVDHHVVRAAARRRARAGGDAHCQG